MSPSTPPPKTWDARQIKYMGMARSDPNATLEQRRKATAALPLPKLAQGVNTREIKIKRLPLKGFEENVSGEIDALVFDPPGTHKGFDLPTLLYVHGGWSFSLERGREGEREEEGDGLRTGLTRALLLLNNFASF